MYSSIHAWLLLLVSSHSSSRPTAHQTGRVTLTLTMFPSCGKGSTPPSSILTIYQGLLALAQDELRSDDEFTSSLPRNCVAKSSYNAACLCGWSTDILHSNAFSVVWSILGLVPISISYTRLYPGYRVNPPIWSIFGVQKSWTT